MFNVFVITLFIFEDVVLLIDECFVFYLGVFFFWEVRLLVIFVLNLLFDFVRVIGVLIVFLV